MRRWTLLLAGAALWLFLAAVPALADGGPHVASVNNGASVADGRQLRRLPPGPHRPGRHAPRRPAEEELCLTCHGAASTGATTDVVTGVQYVARRPTAPAAATQLGALRERRLRPGPDRVGQRLPDHRRQAPATSGRRSPSIATPQDVTSAHLALTENGLTPPGRRLGQRGHSATPDAGPDRRA